MESTYYNPLQTYTAAEVGALMHASAELVRTWAEAGLIRGIKSGKAVVYTADEIRKLQSDYTGEDISNLKRAIDTKSRKEAVK